MIFNGMQQYDRYTAWQGYIFGKIFSSGGTGGCWGKMKKKYCEENAKEKNKFTS